MNLGLSRIATVKASRLPKRLRRHFDIKPSCVGLDLLTAFEVIGYTVLLESDISIGRHKAQRCLDAEVVLGDWAEASALLSDRLYNVLKQINPTVSTVAIETAISKVIFTQSSNLFENNRLFHQHLTQGVDVAYQENHQTVHQKVWLIDASNLLNNDWLVIHPLTLIEGSSTHCLNALVFINGLPLAVIICSDPQDKNATLKKGYQQLQFYKQQIPTLFSYNAFLIIANRNQARVGTLTSEWEEFLPWRTIDNEDFPHQGETELEVLIQGIFDKRRFLELINHFIVFENNPASISKQLLRHRFCTTPYPKTSCHS
ncbi:type I restriction endonuclease subunit R [Tolypothrix campylonemoides VB511288]|nr:type I restriction endonuclease subunit R [Tolypothrix campylonemoides VB511288]